MLSSEHVMITPLRSTIAQIKGMSLGAEAGHDLHGARAPALLPSRGMRAGKGAMVNSLPPALNLHRRVAQYPC